MNKEEVESRIRSAFAKTIDDNGTKIEDALTDETVLLETALDSLGFAILVARLEEDLGWDPFSISDTPFYPETFGQFVAFYADNQP
ncbi:hypothetical protein FF80_00627 [Devosia sp. LC5]|uniref:hypothetical protein n=1 Tax=Devosia sp. LC5 TaxID=1502724 RepID=UPI0004E37839|nr:hypothetical protein [Devosia sp. LC5]KFC71184.1 hypothetical protein FF80_00627 [Devosia sp. LC5]